MRKIPTLLTNATATMLSLVAVLFVNSASVLFVNQPETPEELLK